MGEIWDRLRHVCVPRVGRKLDGRPHLMIVQKALSNVISLRELVEDPDLPLDTFLRIFVKVFYTLEQLQNGPYKVTHSDLHTKNILVTRDGSNVWIIDWGMASFTLDGQRFKQFIERDYQYSYPDEVDLLSGVYDMNFFLCNMMSAQSDVIRTWCYTMRTFLFNKKFKCMKADGTISKLRTTTGFQSWWYDVLEHKEAGNSVCHDYNVTRLNELTYSVLLEKIRLADHQMDTIYQEISLHGVLGKKNKSKRSKRPKRMKRNRIS